MRDVGFLYVLANSAMQGIVKVGKTIRSPSERAAELSAATGLPTPFIVVYEQLFEDCTEAETFVHTLLASKGFRVADNREFFSAPVNEVVRAIALAPGAIDEDINQEASEEEDDDGLISSRPAGDELDDLTITSTPSIEPWESVYAEAECYYYGFEDFIQDFSEAMRLYKQAAKLGSLDAYEKLGNMHEEGKGVRVSEKLALDYYKEGARRGSLLCYWRMADLFLKTGAEDNAIKCFRLFIKGFQERDTTSKGYVDTSQLDSIALNAGHCFIMSKVKDSYKLPGDIWAFIDGLSERIIKQSNFMIDLCTREGELDYAAQWRETAAHFRKKSELIGTQFSY